jgi:hypothetical protein
VTGARRPGPWDVLTVIAALVVLVAFGRAAGALLVHPWDWSPDEGLALDYARRLLRAPGSLYGREVVPFPAAYTPLLPALLAPIVLAATEPLLPARALALAWTAVAAASVFLLVRRRNGWALGLVAVAIVLAPRDLSVWFLLVRVDGLMIALWLAAAALLMPARLEKGADALSGARSWAGAALLLLAVLAKPTAAVHGAPLVLGWLLVDRRSASRLIVMMLVGGSSAFLALQVATGGGFLATMRLWGVHTSYLSLFWFLSSSFVTAHAMLLVLVATALVTASRRGERPLRDGAWLLVLGGLGILPALGKVGAWTNYLLPLYCALVVLVGRLWPRNPPLAVMLPAALGLALLARPFPLPTPADHATSAFLYSFVRERGGPILATRPDYAYYIVDQPVEAEGSSLHFLVAARIAGTEKLVERMRRHHYRLVVATPQFWPNDPSFVAALEGYEMAAKCTLGYFYGRTEFFMFVPRGDGGRPAPVVGARCLTYAAGPGPAAP